MEKKAKKCLMAAFLDARFLAGGGHGAGRLGHPQTHGGHAHARAEHLRRRGQRGRLPDRLPSRQLGAIGRAPAAAGGAGPGIWLGRARIHQGRFRALPVPRHLRYLHVTCRVTTKRRALYVTLYVIDALRGR